MRRGGGGGTTRTGLFEVKSYQAFFLGLKIPNEPIPLSIYRLEVCLSCLFILD
jgi:hypothetical protein